MIMLAFFTKNIIERVNPNIECLQGPESFDVIPSPLKAISTQLADYSLHYVQRHIEQGHLQ